MTVTREWLWEYTCEKCGYRCRLRSPYRVTTTCWPTDDKVRDEVSPRDAVVPPPEPICTYDGQMMRCTMDPLKDALDAL